MTAPSQPRAFGDYVVERELGRGGMGVVYAATHAGLGKRVAIKVLLADVSRDRELVERFQNEARAASAIEHPSIVEIHTVGQEAGAVYIVMELLQGESLAARLRARGACSIADAIALARQCANALDAAHRVGIIHRDLKPDNVFLVPDIEVAGGERVKLLDFGIAKLVGLDTQATSARTVTGAILGTPHYMSPEQCEGAREVDARSDLYSLGCMVFQMVTGRLPFQSAGVGGLIGMHLHVAPPTLASLRPDVPPELDALVAQLLAKAPEDRPHSAAQVAATLASISPRASRSTTPPPPVVEMGMVTVATVATVAPPPKKSRAVRVLAIACGVVIAGLIGFVVMRERESERDESLAQIPSPEQAPVPQPPPPVAPVTPADDELAVARRMLVDGELDSAVYMLGRLRARLPQDPAVQAFAAELGRVRARRVLDGMRVAAAAGKYEDVRRGVDQVQVLTDDGELRAAATALWTGLRTKVLEAVQAKVHTLASKADCEGARGAARLGEGLGASYAAVLADCRERQAKLASRRRSADVVLDRIRTTTFPEHITSACNQLIDLDVERVPWNACVQAACQWQPAFADGIIGRAPTATRDALQALCRQITGGNSPPRTSP